MRGIAKLFIIFLVSFSELSISENINQEAAKNKLQGIDEPKDCIKNHVLPCAILNEAKRLTFIHFGTKVSIGSKTTIVLLSNNMIQIINGNVWIYSKSRDSEFIVKSEYGSVKSEGLIHTFFAKSAEIFEIYPLRGKVSVYPVGDKGRDGLELRAGYRSQLGPVAVNGRAFYEFPQPANLKGLLKRWAHLFDGDPDQLVKEVSAYKEPWLQAAEESSRWQKEIAQRMIASYEEKQKKIQRQREARLREEKALRNLFRKKNYLDVSP